MSQSVRTRLIRVPKAEQEVRVNTDSRDTSDPTASTPLIIVSTSPVSSLSTSTGSQREFLLNSDSQTPHMTRELSPNSRWFVVRRNLHRIRFMGLNERGRDKTMPSFYLGLQMKRELKRAQDEIKNIDKEADFRAIKRFALAISPDRVKTYNTSHVKPDDALIYDRLGEEPLALQNLLFYFSKQDVPHGTIFWDFLNGVNHVLSMKRRRSLRVERLRKLALILAIIFYSIIGFMLLLLLISVISTASKMSDPEVTWSNKYSSDNFEKLFQP